MPVAPLVAAATHQLGLQGALRGLLCASATCAAASLHQGGLLGGSLLFAAARQPVATTMLLSSHQQRGLMASSHTSIPLSAPQPTIPRQPVSTTRLYASSSKKAAVTSSSSSNGNGTGGGSNTNNRPPRGAVAEPAAAAPAVGGDGVPRDRVLRAVPGIGKAYMERLAAQGIRSVDELAESILTQLQRQQSAEGAFTPAVKYLQVCACCWWWKVMAAAVSISRDVLARATQPLWHAGPCPRSSPIPTSPPAPITTTTTATISPHKHKHHTTSTGSRHQAPGPRAAHRQAHNRQV